MVTFIELVSVVACAKNLMMEATYVTLILFSFLIFSTDILLGNLSLHISRTHTLYMVRRLCLNAKQAVATQC